MKEKYVYELVDTSDEEIYYSIAVFDTLEAAISMVDGWEDAPDLDNDSDHACAVEIRQRPLNKRGEPQTVWRRSWSRDQLNRPIQTTTVNAD